MTTFPNRFDTDTGTQIAGAAPTPPAGTTLATITRPAVPGDVTTADTTATGTISWRTVFDNAVPSGVSSAGLTRLSQLLG